MDEMERRKLHPGPCNSVGMRLLTDTQTDTQTRVTTIHFSWSTTHAKCNNTINDTVTLWITSTSSFRKWCFNIIEYILIGPKLISSHLKTIHCWCFGNQHPQLIFHCAVHQPSKLKLPLNCCGFESAVGPHSAFDISDGCSRQLAVDSQQRMPMCAIDSDPYDLLLVLAHVRRLNISSLQKSDKTSLRLLDGGAVVYC